MSDIARLRPEQLDRQRSEVLKNRGSASGRQAFCALRSHDCVFDFPAPDGRRARLLRSQAAGERDRSGVAFVGKNERQCRRSVKNEIAQSRPARIASRAGMPKGASLARRRSMASVAAPASKGTSSAIGLPRAEMRIRSPRATARSSADRCVFASNIPTVRI